MKVSCIRYYIRHKFNIRKYLSMKRFILIAILPLAILVMAFKGSNTNKQITWYSFKKAQELAKADDKKVLVYAMATWCTYCKKVEKEVFPKEAVAATMEKYYYPVWVDIDSSEKMEYNGEVMTGSQFAQKYRVRGTPTFFFIDKQGKILGAQPGFVPEDTFITLLSFVGSDAYQESTFKEYAAQN